MTRAGYSSGDHGSVLVLVTLWLPIVVLFAMFVLEVGNWYEHKRHLQTQADAAALAGGGMFQSCFGGAGDADIFKAASTYAGAGTASMPRGGKFAGTEYGTSAYNWQIGNGNQGVVSALYQSSTWADGTADPDPSQTTGPCTAPYQFDVKTSETSLPLFFGGFVPSLPFVPAINAQARVQLHALGAAAPSMPLAVPDINPKAVSVTFVDEGAATGASTKISCPGSAVAGDCVFALSGPTATNGINAWSGTVTLPAIAGATNLAMRIGVGSTVGSCAGTAGNATYYCYDYNAGGSASTFGVERIRVYPSGGTGTTSAPILRSVNPSSCSGSPFFGDANASGGSCNVWVDADIDFGSTVDYTMAQVRANFKGSSGGTTTVALTHTSGKHWTSASAALPVEKGPYNVTLDWKYGTGGFNGFNSGHPVQEVFSAADGSDPADHAGPILAASVTDGSGISTYAVPTGSTATLNVTIGIAGGVHLATPCTGAGSGGGYSCATDKPQLLRFASGSGSTNYAVNCGTVQPQGAGQNNDIYQQIRYGCANKYSINVPDVCPDPANPSPTDCAQVSNFVGDKVGPSTSAFSDRFAPSGVCTANNYPSPALGDPRVVILIVTDFSAFNGSGAGTLVPVVNYAAFYVTGWDKAPNGCNGINEPPPPADGTGNSANIWGHFIKWAVIGGTGSPGICDPSALTPCVPVLTK